MYRKCGRPKSNLIGHWLKFVWKWPMANCYFVHCNMYLFKNNLAVKKVWPCSKWPVWKSCESQEMTVMVYVDGKILITTIQVNLCCLILGISTKFTWIVVTKILPSTYTITAISWPPLWFHNFFSDWPFWIGPHLFLQPGCFWVFVTFLQDVYLILADVCKEYWMWLNW